MQPINPEHLATVICRLRNSRIDDAECLMAYLVCEVADMLPVIERNEWHNRCDPTKI